jgi:hypothetical protein
MKALKFSFIIAIAAVVTLGFGAAAYAFHSGGVAECEGCHTMHNSLNGESMVHGGTVGVAPAYLLQGNDQSSACLNCHGPYDHNTGAPAKGGYHILSTYVTGSGVQNYTPGGDFAWLTKDYAWVPRSGASTEYSPGYMHGHNIIAADYGLTSPDPRFATSGSPGGGYPATTFGCHSCHDPHGKARILSTGVEARSGEPIYSSGSYGAMPTNYNGTGTLLAVGMYRLLGSTGYEPMSQPGYAFTSAAMRGANASSYNAPDTTLQGLRTAYGANSAEWCANCHNAMHSVLSTVPGSHVHPTGTPIPSYMITNYNSYVKTGDMTGAKATAFNNLAPFQSDGNLTNAQLKAIQATTVGVESGDRVICFSCHRAHASGWDSMTRFPLGNEFTTGINLAGQAVYADSAGRAQGRTADEFQSAMNGKPATVFSAYQRALCNKCHAKD